MELHEAMRQISAIRQQMARTEQFRGYRAAPAAFSGLMAFAAGGVQTLILPEPENNLPLYLMLWISVAGISFLCSMMDIWCRYSRTAGHLQQETTRLAIGQFLPPLFAGGLVTLAILRAAPEAAWILPGLWAIFFSLSLFSSWRLLPRPIFGVALYFMAAGLLTIGQGSPAFSFSRWTMPLIFGIGQLASALVLFLDEQSHSNDDQPQERVR